MLNQKKVVIEWEKAGLKKSGFMFQDITEMYELAERNTESTEEANKLLILAIRAAAKNGGKSALAVENNLTKWINAGATTATEVGEYEKQSQQLQQPRQRFGQPLRNESPVAKFTPEQMAEQSKRLAKEDGFDDPEEWIKAAMETFRQLRATRTERMAKKSEQGLTATGRSVIRRF
ncbi:hypothetical protein [Weissella cibaria]|uniref:hypothetical protein n=1 Tax=Weissella cibaria TaxID=137591 RepID=UPI0034E8CE77